MTAIDDYFGSVQYDSSPVGDALKEHNDAIAALTDLQDSGADPALVAAAAKKVNITFANYQDVLLNPPATPPPGSTGGAPPPATSGAPPYTPPTGTGKIIFPVISPKIAPVITGEPVTTVILTGVSVILSVLGIGGLSDVKKAVEKIATGLKTVGQQLINAVWSLAHNIRWVLNALRWVWERVLNPLIDHLGALIGRVATVINRVLRPYLDLIQKIRKHILEIYVRWFYPVISFLQKVRRVVAILELLHIPGMKALDQKIAKIEGKLIGVVQQILLRVNDHSGLLNILMTARMTLQHGVLIRSLYETQGAWVNQWWNSQEWDRSPADAEASVQLDLQIQAQPHVKALRELLTTGVYTATDTKQPHETELEALLTTGAV